MIFSRVVPFTFVYQQKLSKRFPGSTEPASPHMLYLRRLSAYGLPDYLKTNVIFFLDSHNNMATFSTQYGVCNVFFEYLTS